MSPLSASERGLGGEVDRRHPFPNVAVGGFLLAFACLLFFTPAAPAQEVSRYGILLNDDLYRQKSPKDALAAVVLAIERERFDYLAAHLMPKDFVDARLQRSAAYYEKVAADQLAGTAQGASLAGAELQARVRQKAEILNFKHLTDAIRAKMTDEPDTLKTLKRFLRDGEVAEAGDAATISLKDVKDRAVYLKKVDGRWVFENRREDPPAKE